MTTPRASQPLHVALGPASDEEILTGPNEQPSSSQCTCLGLWKVLEMIFPVTDARKLHPLAIFVRYRSIPRVLLEPRYTKEGISYV